MSVAERAAKWVSVMLSNPIVGSIFGYVMGISESKAIWGVPDAAVALLSALFMGVFPYLGALASFFAGESDIFVSKREQRPILMLIALPTLAIGALYFYVNGLPLLSSLLLLMLAESLIFLVITFRWKISIHVAGLTFPLIFIWIRNGIVGLMGLPLLPLLMWARVRIGAHTWGQVVASALVSATVTYWGSMFLIPVGGGF